MSGPAHLGRSILDGGDNADIGAATADVAAHVFADLLGRRCMSLVYAGDRRHDLPRSAVAALQSIMIDERLLHRVQGPVSGRKALDRGYLMPIGLHRKREA